MLRRACAKCVPSRALRAVLYRLLYRVIRLEEEQLRLRDSQEEQWATIAGLCDDVVNLGMLVNEQREVMNKLTAGLDHHTEAIQWIITRERQSRKQLRKIRKFAIKRSRCIEEKFRGYDKILDDLAGRFKEMKI